MLNTIPMKIKSFFMVKLNSDCEDSKKSNLIGKEGT